MRLIAYARVSTGDQQTIEAQVDKTCAFAGLHDHEIVNTFKDEGVSGKNTDRPGLQAVLEALKTQDVDGVIITKLDRLSRSVRDWCDLMEIFDKSSKVLISVYDSIDTSTAAGRMIANMFATIAQWERETIAERTRSSMHYLRKKGRRLSAKLPFGFTTDPEDDSKLIPCLHEHPILRKIRRYRSEGKGFSDIAATLNRNGVPSRSGNGWTRSNVWKILKRCEVIRE